MERRINLWKVSDVYIPCNNFLFKFIENYLNNETSYGIMSYGIL